MTHERGIIKCQVVMMMMHKDENHKLLSFLCIIRSCEQYEFHESYMNDAVQYWAPPVLYTSQYGEA